MFFSLLVSYKETFEAALIIGSIVIYLSKYGKAYKILYLYLGAAIGMLLSLLVIIFGIKTIQGITGNIRNIIQSAALFFVSFFIVFFIVLINKQDNSASNYVSKNIRYIENSAGLFFIAFFIEFKEGIELTFFNIISLNNSIMSVLMGTIIGMIFSVLSVYIFLNKVIKLDVRFLLRVVSIFLITAAGLMLGQSVFITIPVRSGMYKLLIDALFISVFLLSYIKITFSAEKS